MRKTVRNYETLLLFLHTPIIFLRITYKHLLLMLLKNSRFDNYNKT